MSKQRIKVPCSFTTRAGRACRAWAVRGSDPPACSSHLRANPDLYAAEQACSGRFRASRRGGKGETAGASYLWAGAGEDVPEASFYDLALSDEEFADLANFAAELSLEAEIACTRRALRHTLEFLQERSGSMSEAEYLRATGLLFQGAHTVARLLREQRALTGGEDNRLKAIIDAALDGLSEDLGIQL